MLVGNKLADAAHEAVEDGQHFGARYVSGASQEHGFAEGDARKEALQLTREGGVGGEDLLLARVDSPLVLSRARPFPGVNFSSSAQSFFVLLLSFFFNSLVSLVCGWRGRHQ